MQSQFHRQHIKYRKCLSSTVVTIELKCCLYSPVCCEWSVQHMTCTVKQSYRTPLTSACCHIITPSPFISVSEVHARKMRKDYIIRLSFISITYVRIFSYPTIKFSKNTSINYKACHFIHKMGP